jgi:Ni/Co efflux regulator RcnB
MKGLLISAAALALLSAPAAYAQQQQDQHDHHHDDGGQSGQKGSGGQKGGQSGGSGQGSHQGGAGGAGSPASQAQGAQPGSKSAGGQGVRQSNGGGQVQSAQGPQGAGGGQNGRTWTGPGSTAGSHPGVAAIPDRKPAAAQPSGRPDWEAYYRANPDLQRAYKQNQQSPGYHESIEAFAQRHYEEHGKSEGRALPTVQGGSPQGRGNAGARNWKSLQRNFTSPHRYRLPAYRWPRGFSYRRFVFGDILPPLFIGPDYYIYDYAEYGLPYPPPGTVWVRYGPDALLVDRYSGEIIEVAYGVFY